MNLLQAQKLTLAYGRTPVVHGVSLALPDRPGGVGLIGESGSGKTTLARALLGLIRPRAGRVVFRGADIHTLERRDRRRYRSEVQPVFQEGSEALDPRMRVIASLREALRLGRGYSVPAVAELLSDVGLAPHLGASRPHELSGGQRQRVIIARALAVRPRLLILDEPTSALDVTVQRHILDLLDRLSADRGLSYLLITHNLALVDRMCETIHVMFAGRVVEAGPTARLLDRPAHPYTAALRAAVPVLGGAPPEAGQSTEPPALTGCAFRTRCPLAIDRCAVEMPSLRGLEDGRAAACHRAEELGQEKP